MYRVLRLAPRLLGASIALSSCCSPAVAETAGSFLCLTDGVIVKATRIETRDNKFFVYSEGAEKPTEYPAGAVQGVNLSNCASAPAPTSVFGVHGSNTIGERLMPMLVDAFARRRAGSAAIVTLTGPEEQRIVLPPTLGRSVAIDLQAHGSGTAAKDMASGQAVIGMASRRLNADETKLLSDQFHVNPLAAANEHVLALDGLAIIVNPKNPVQSLSLNQIARVFSGEINNWKEIGGADRPIKVLRRDEKSGTFDTFKNLVLAPAHLSILPGIAAFESSETLSERITNDPDAIGFVGLPYVNKNAVVSIASSCALVSRPTKFSIKTEEYPLTRRLYLYTLGEPSEKVASDLLRFALSDDAQPTIEEAEFVEQSVALQDAEEQKRWAEAALTAAANRRSVAAADFMRTIAAARRSSAVLRFESNSAQLDNKAMQDVDRLARFLFGKKFYVIGFADSTGGSRNNERLARERAEAVAEALRRVGLHVPADSVKSYSSFAPVACNEETDGATKNRRVEVWVAR
ncbi:MAG TPA: phosphate ABC transporter substrate-binding/OmpA family protein [Methylocystis sp.]|nr:phosphate ABC transporter substrate-binding/OmpA family protein [Methylocystis sp.]